MLEDGRVDADGHNLGGQVGRDCPDKVLLVRVERGPTLGEIGLGKADVACFFKDVQLADLTGDRDIAM